MGDRPDELERLHEELLRELRRLPQPATAGVLGFGPAAAEVERFVAFLSHQTAASWAQVEEYRRNLERNPLVRSQVASSSESLLQLAARTGRSPALRSAAEAALGALPPAIHASWELMTILAAWAIALGDVLTAAELEACCRPFVGFQRPGAPPPAGSRPPGAAQPPPPRPPAAPGIVSPPSVPPDAQRQPEPTFADVGGMEDVKASLRTALQDVLANPQVAARLRVRLGGILLYGPPGNGKSFLARATAGEFRLVYLPATSDALTEEGMGDAPGRLRQLFERARQRVPCLLFLDDIDAIAPPGGASPNEARRLGIRAALIECLGRAPETPGLVVMAATDALEMVDEGVVRDGLFDFKIQVHDPDPPARRQILEKQLDGRHQLTAGDLEMLVGRTEGRSAGYIASLVNRAAQRALHRTLEASGEAVITGADVRAALEDRAGTVGVRQEHPLSWDDLVLPEETIRRLRVLQSTIENPQRAAALGVARIPRGAILYGPPRTGKTSIARVFAAQTRCSFFALSGTELTSKWVGETEKRIRDLFREAREARPAIVFVDEIDSIAATRGEDSSRAYDSALNQLLTELDGFQTTEGVFVIGATNRFDLLDPAIVAGGRLSEHIEIPAPDREGRERLLRLYSRKMPLDPSVDLHRLAEATWGLAGGDIESLCTTAAMQALGRESERVSEDDFEEGLRSVRRSAPS